MTSHFYAVQFQVPVFAKGDSSSYVKSGTGVDFYDFNIGDGADAKVGDKVTLNIKGFLAGRQGWVFLNTYDSQSDNRIRLFLGVTPCIEGLKLGITGSG